MTKVAVVTGGTRGIGKATCLTLAEMGYDIATCGRIEDDGASMSMRLSEIGIQDLCCVADLVNQSERARFVSDVLKKFGTVHILVNNVGGGGRWGDYGEPHKEDGRVWKNVYHKNVIVAVDMIHAFLPYMMKQRWGRVVNVTSIYGKEGGGAPWFNAAKAAQISMMKCFANYKLYTRKGITFNSVAPGPISTGGWRELAAFDPDTFAAECEIRPMGRLGTPMEVATTIAYLCTEHARFINGACIAIDGGEGRSF